jgi:hypothetical protein
LAYWFFIIIRKSEALTIAKSPAGDQLLLVPGGQFIAQRIHDADNAVAILNRYFPHIF